MRDDKIVELYWKRDEGAVRQTEIKYGHYLTKLAYRILADWEDSRESVNDTYLSAWRSIPPHRPENLQTYLCRITRQTAIDIFRRRKSAKRQASEYALSLSELEDCLSAGDTTQRDADRNLLSETIRSYLMTLPEGTRDAFLCRYFFADSLRETARYCGMSEAGVKSLLYRTRIGLKKHLEKEGFFDEE